MRRSRKIILNAPVRGRDFQEPRFSRGAHLFTLLAGKTYLRRFEGVETISLQGADRIIDEFRAFHRGDSRLLIVFRHAAKEDAPVLAYTFDTIIPRLMRATHSGPLGFIPHVRFLYGKDVLNWAGRAAVWLFPRMGNIPVVNRGLHKQGLTILKQELRTGTFPIALAPEGQVTYHMYHCSEIEKGAAVLAAWAMDSGLPVHIVPISIRYQYSDDPYGFTREIVRRWEKETGEHLEITDTGTEQDDRYRFLVRLLLDLTDKSLALIEQSYRITPASPGSPPADFGKREETTAEETTAEEIAWLQSRIALLNETILQAAEHLSGLDAGGSLLDRVFRIRYHGMARLYPETYDPARLPPLARRLADLQSLEARIYLRHSQIVDVLEYLDPSYLFAPITPETSTVQICSEAEGIGDRICEYGLILLDLMNRLGGGNINTRFTPPHKLVRVIAGSVIDAKDYFATTEREQGPGDRSTLSRGKGKEQVGRLHQEIFRSLAELSDPTR